MTVHYNDPSPLARRVMRRVRIIYACRPLLSIEALAVFLFAASFVDIAREVALTHVFENMPNVLNFFAFDQFWLFAFTHTEHTVQIFTLIALGTAAFLAVAAARSLVPVLRHARSA